MKRIRLNTPELWLSTLGLVALGALFALWWAATPSVTPAGRISAALSAALFAVVCLRFVPVWMDFWRGRGLPTLPETKRVDTGPTPRGMTWKIFLSLLAVDVGVLLLVFVLRRLLGDGSPFGTSLEFWRCTDSLHYLDIAREGYLSVGEWDRLVQLVFLPGYPVVVFLFNLVIGYDLYAGLVVSALAFAGAGCVLYRLMRLDLPHQDAIRGLKYLCLLPGLFFFTAPMSESLFLLLCAACLYCARTERWALGCLLGGCAAFTRSLGLTLLVPLFFELVRWLRTPPVRRAAGRDGWLARGAALLLIPAGFAVYLGVNYAVSGNPLQFMEYQSTHWGQHLGLFFHTAAYQLEEAVKQWPVRPHYTLGLWLPNLAACFSSLALMAWAGKRLRPSDTAWFLSYFVVAVGATWLLSAPRYLLVCIPILLALVRLTKHKWADLAVTVCLIPLSLFYLYAFVERWQVW